MRPRLLIVGASGRAAAASAIRAGYDPFVIDLFADADTIRLCPVLKCDPGNYPHGFIQLAEQAPASPWMYTGGLENHPDVVEAISKGRELWGNGPEVLKWARDPYSIDGYVVDGQIYYTPPTSAFPGSTAGNYWLRKPFRGSGGSGIRFAEHGDRQGEDYYFQQFITGEVRSSIFRDTALLSETIQLIGTPWLHAKPFRYAGNILTAATRPLVASLFKCDPIKNETSELSGPWGMDWIASQEGRYLVEINPRYTAAMELLELPCDGVVAKGIYYAPHSFTFPNYGPWDDSLTRCTDVSRMHDFADIPHPGTLIEAGQPVLTIFAQGNTEADCLQSLQRRAAELDRLFGWEKSP